jgi:hypothetical protein
MTTNPDTARRETLLRRIQKLISLSKNNPNEHEAAAAAAQAQRLLLANKLTMSELSEVDRSKADPLVNESFEIGTRADKWKLSLAGAVAKGFSCQFCYMSGSRYGRKAHIYFVGRKSDVDVAWYMYGYLANILSDLAPKAFDAEYRRRVLSRDYEMAEAMKPLAWQNDFRTGAIHVLRDRLAESEEQFASSHSDCRAVVLVSKAEVSKFFKEMHPRLRAGSGGRPVASGGAYEAGRAAGATIQLRRGIGGNGNGGGPLALTGGGS